MTDHTTHLAKLDQTSYLDADDTMTDTITRSLDKLSRDISPLTAWRLRKVRGAEALKLTESSLADYMAAKRRVFAYQVGLTEDHARKVMLAESMNRTAQLESEIARIISDAVSSFETLILGQEEAAYREEITRVDRAETLRDEGKISEARCAQMIANTQASTDSVVATVQRTTRELLENLEGRFRAALVQG